MASSSSTSEKPQNGELGLGLMIPDTASCDPIPDQGVEKEFSDSQNAQPPEEKNESLKGIEKDGKENATDVEEVEFRDDIEREIRQLTLEQAEIEAALQKPPEIDGNYKEGNEIKTTTSLFSLFKSLTTRKTIVQLFDSMKKPKAIPSLSIHPRDANENGGEEKYEKDAESENIDEEKGGKDAENENSDVGKDGKDAQYGKEEDGNEGAKENENGTEEEEEGGGGELGEVTMNEGRYNNYSNRRFNYPVRPDAEDCAYYVKMGSCKYGSNCKFNHPSQRKNQDGKERAKPREENPERAGQIECKYYLTLGGCKYGKACKYYHGRGKSSVLPPLGFNFLGLPIRPGEKECPYYMHNGSCKYGSGCRFHHPDPTTEHIADPSSGYGNGGSLPTQGVSPSSVSSWSSSRALNEAASFAPIMLPTTQVVPSLNSEWNGYQAATYPTSERSLPTPPAFSMNKLPTDMNLWIQQQHDMVVQEYPERPGEPECSFFLKTGDCKFKSNCKYHHPKKRIPKTKATSCALNDKGLPLRPDQPICTHYHRYGICKYGPGCRYDHPANFGISQPPFDPPPFNSNC